jgi:3-phenylpropionate/cinnamic acid dioxygenase small subunit
MARLKMAEDSMALSTEDRLAIHELLALHGHLMDERQFSRLHELFTEDVVYDVEAFGAGTVRGIERFRELVINAGEHNPIGHHVTNVIITEDEGGTARVWSKGIGVLADGKTGSAVYNDVVVKTPQGWRLAHRVVVPRRAPSVLETT